ncbi:UNVERIFIED_CONTAM: hypothetical protein HDU68_004352, partial [Siphonaria sp. JEL0065]
MLMKIHSNDVKVREQVGLYATGSGKDERTVEELMAEIRSQQGGETIGRPATVPVSTPAASVAPVPIHVEATGSSTKSDVGRSNETLDTFSSDGSPSVFRKRDSIFKKRDSIVSTGLLEPSILSKRVSMVPTLREDSPLHPQSHVQTPKSPLHHQNLQEVYKSKFYKQQARDLIQVKKEYNLPVIPVSKRYDKNHHSYYQNAKIIPISILTPNIDTTFNDSGSIPLLHPTPSTLFKKQSDYFHEQSPTLPRLGHSTTTKQNRPTLTEKESTTRATILASMKVESFNEASVFHSEPEFIQFKQKYQKPDTPVKKKQ